MVNNLPDKNPMISHYLQELHVLSTEIIQNFQKVESIVNSKSPETEAVFSFPNNNDKYFFIQPEVFTMIDAILLHSANIKKILFATPRKRNESSYKFEYRKKRTEEIQSYLDMDKISEIKNIDVRNSLEHYDERLDNISLRLRNGTIDKDYQIIASNVILSSEGALYGTPYYLKSYIIDSKIYKNSERESNLGRIYSEALYIQNTTKEYYLTSSVIPIPQK